MSLENQAQELIAPLVKAGFDSRDAIIERVIEMLQDDFPDEDNFRVEALVEKLTDSTLQQHLLDQETWITPTDCDRLDMAFALLEMQGIVVRQNFACCQSCGHAEIWGEMEDRSQVRGYAFYHQQDTEHVVEYRDLFLAFSSASKADADDIVIGQAIVEVLQNEGLTVQWDGSFRTRILLKGLDWKRRR